MAAEAQHGETEEFVGSVQEGSRHPSGEVRLPGLGLAGEHGDVAGEQVANEERLLVRDVLDLVELAPLGGDGSHGLSGPFL
ncbi:hypothetical protein GCM10010340_23470 [Streptomyces griseoloalbus]|nr:hypothetical protein GCM10010340_23470 [Streptomyces albaduncus]